MLHQPLASCGGYDATVSLRRVLTTLADEGKDIVLVAHSYGGVVASTASEGLSADRGVRGALRRIPEGIQTVTHGIEDDGSDPSTRVLTTLADEGKDIVLVAHSYGGVVASTASEGLVKPS
jgi:predicted alpha/beta hydrolase family esterase